MADNGELGSLFCLAKLFFAAMIQVIKDILVLNFIGVDAVAFQPVKIMLQGSAIDTAGFFCIVLLLQVFFKAAHFSGEYIFACFPMSCGLKSG